MNFARMTSSCQHEGHADMKDVTSLLGQTVNHSRLVDPTEWPDMRLYSTLQGTSSYLHHCVQATELR